MCIVNVFVSIKHEFRLYTNMIFLIFCDADWFQTLETLGHFSLMLKLALQARFYVTIVIEFNV